MRGGSHAFFGELLLLLVHLRLLLVGLGLGARLGLAALFGALVGLRLALGLQCVVVGEVTDRLLDLALGFFHDTHGWFPSDLGPLGRPLLGIERLCLRLVRVGLRLLADRLELLGSLGLLSLAGVDQPLLVEDLTGDLLAEADDLVEQAGGVLRIYAGDTHARVLRSMLVFLDLQPFSALRTLCPRAGLLTRSKHLAAPDFTCGSCHSTM